MTVTELIIQALDKISESEQLKVLDYVQHLGNGQAQAAIEDAEDLAEAEAVLKEIETEGTVSWEFVRNPIAKARGL
jgi:hypothetical protein